MPSDKKLAKIALILLSISIFLVIITASIYVSAIFNLMYYDDSHNSFSPLYIVAIILVFPTTTVSIAADVIAMIVAIKGLSAKNNVVYILLLIGIFIVPIMAIICLCIILSTKEEVNNIPNMNNQKQEIPTNTSNY